MLESILYQNFQVHRNKFLEFDPLVNIIVGPTDAGKSSALRGLIWVLLNQPRGDHFISHGEDFCQNTLGIDGHEIVRGKKKSLNFYSLDGGSPFEAFGSAIPDEIANLLKVDPISIQRQLDPPYWFLLSPGEVSRELNSIVNLELIDEVLTFFSSYTKKTKMAVSFSEEKLAQAEKKKEELSWVLDLEMKIDDLEAKEAELEELESQISSLSSLLTRLDQQEKDKIRLARVLTPLEELIQLGGIIQEEEKKISALKSLLASVSDNKSRRRELEQKIEALETQLEQELAGKCPLCGGAYAERESLHDCSLRSTGI